MRLHTLAATTATLAATAAFITIAPSGTALAASGGQTDYSVNPIMVKSPFQASATTKLALPSPAACASIYGLACNTPQTIRAAYDIPATIDGVPAGTGSTIVIVDAFGSPTAQADLDKFSASMGIASTKLNIYYPDGKVVWKGTDLQNGWAGETSLDLQWAHAIAPGATIDLVVADKPQDQVMNNAVSWAVSTLHPDSLSMSYGSAESGLASSGANNEQNDQSAKIFAAAAAQGVSVFASAGDDYSDNGAGFENYATPAADPNVTSVGGTNLLSNIDPSGPAETVWNDSDPSLCALGCSYGGFGGTGGAPSLVTSKQGADVAYNASVYTAVMVEQSFDPANTGLYFTGGTSAGSPQWAAIAADLVQSVGHDLGNLRPSLPGWAAAGGLRDVTVGNNASPTFSGGYAAGAGYDSPTGWGTPDVGKLLALVD